METTKYTKEQLVEAFETFRKSNEIIKSITADVEPVVENAVNACVEKSKDIRFVQDGKGNYFTLRQAVAIVSPLFKSFIELYFVDDRRIARTRKSDLTKDEIDDGQWQLVLDYRKGKVEPQELYTGLYADALDGSTARIRLELESTDIAEIYSAEDLTVGEEDGIITVQAGDYVLMQVIPAADGTGSDSGGNV